jgi:hypothetical protein
MLPCFCAFVLREYMIKQGRCEPRPFPFGGGEGEFPSTMLNVALAKS